MIEGIETAEQLNRLRDLAWVPEADTEVEPVSIDSPDGLNVLRHSTAHVLAQAVQDVFPEAKLGIVLVLAAFLLTAVRRYEARRRPPAP